jgi:hypothetical protein
MELIMNLHQEANKEGAVLKREQKMPLENITNPIAGMADGTSNHRLNQKEALDHETETTKCMVKGHQQKCQ